MAIGNNNNNNNEEDNVLETINGSPSLNVEAIQTVVPIKATDPIPSRPVFLPPPHLVPSLGIFSRCFQAVMFYTGKAGSGWAMAGWMKDSLGWALSEEPMFAGRIRPTEEEDGGDDGKLLEIVACDSGARLMEASVSVDMAQFLDIKGASGEEAQLVLWEDISEHSPQFSPLFFVQVTNFKCGGFSIGISCSLMVADPFSITRFLKRWSEIHNNLVAASDEPEMPLFRLHNFKLTACSSPPLQINRKTNTPAGQTMIFRLLEEALDLSVDMYKNLAAGCINEAAKRVGLKTGMNFSLFLKEESGDLKIGNCSKEELDQKLVADPVDGLITPGDWDDLEVKKVCFSGVISPSRVKFWIDSVCEESLVMIVQSPEDGSGNNKAIIVTIPC